MSHNLLSETKNPPVSQRAVFVTRDFIPAFWLARVLLDGRDCSQFGARFNRPKAPSIKSRPVAEISTLASSKACLHSLVQIGWLSLGESRWGYFSF